MVLKLPFCGIESIADRYINVLVCVSIAWLSIDNDISAGHRDVDSDVKDIALMVSRIFASDDNATPNDAIVKAFKAGRPFTHARLNGIGMGQILKCNLKWEAHHGLASSTLQQCWNTLRTTLSVTQAALP